MVWLIIGHQLGVFIAVPDDICPLKTIKIAIGNAQYLFSENPPIIFPSLLVNTGIAPLLPSIIINIPWITYITPINVIRDNISTAINDFLSIKLAKALNIKLNIANIVLEYAKSTNLGL